MRPNPWELRFDWIFSVLTWGSVALGLVSSVGDTGATLRVTAAAVVAIGYAAVMQVLPRDLRRRSTTGELLTLLGIIAGVGAAALTGGVASPYLLFLASPVFFAAAFLGVRRGLQTAILAAVGVVAMAAAGGETVASSATLQPSAFYLLIAISFAQARRILREAQAEKAELEAASFRDADTIDRLVAANNLLTSLGRLAGAAELNPVTVGEAALRDLAVIVAFRAGRVELIDGDRLLTVAKRGVEGPEELAERFEMSVGDRPLAVLTLWPDRAATLDADRDLIEDALRPVALAFENTRLLRDIARRAVREERSRLARDLHDEIGPALASLGLGLDLALQQHETGPEQARDLEMIRHGMGSLVERIRGTVADLREESVDSVVQIAYRLAADVGAEGPRVDIKIDERRPPRPAIAHDLQAILTEAVRNAALHAGATTISIEGAVDHDSGRLVVADDGKGFEPADVPRGHFGLLVMRERTERIGADLAVTSEPGRGTRVSLTW